MSRRNGWFVGGNSTAVAQVVQKAAPSGAIGNQTKLVLNGFSVAGGTTAASTVMHTLRFGPSSGGALSSEPILQAGGQSTGMHVSLSVNGLALEAGFFAIAAGTTTPTGVVATMWGHYG